MEGKKWEALLKHPRPMGRPFMHSWYGPIYANSKEAAIAAAKQEATFRGLRVAKVREIKEPQ
jgi:hypothetical protein